MSEFLQLGRRRHEPTTSYECSAGSKPIERGSPWDRPHSSIHNGLTRRRSYTIGLEHIDSAWSANAPKPLLWGSYARSSSSKRLSFLSRKGPALLVRLTDGTDIVVALDHPEEAAGIVNDLLDRRVPAPPTAQPR